MTFFDKIVKQIFPKQDTAVAKVSTPFLSEQLKRSEKYQREMFKWLNEGRFHEPFEAISKAYDDKLRKLSNSKVDVHILDSPYANGFAISYNSKLMSAKEFSFLFDLMKDRIVPLGYRLHVSDRKIFDRATFVETVDKYYLKPSMPQESNGLFNQLYGNVLIELVTVNDKPSYLKFLVTLYSDRLYTEALPFANLKDNVLA